MIDEVVVTCFCAPNSYTGEDVVEISCHGNQVVVAQVLSELYSAGARPADAGEYTLRAFINGRIDLTQAEAVADLVSAESRQAAAQAVKQLRGGIRKAADKVGNLIAELLKQCELELDFVEEDIELISHDDKIRITADIWRECERMLSGYEKSRLFREGVRVAIVGPPNVGKSSLFNALVGENKAIIHTTPGTTRDVISARSLIGGIMFEFFDTAGLREAGSEVEDEGIRRAVAAAQNAEIVISVTSVDIPDDMDKQVPHGEHTIDVLNKIDLAIYEQTPGVLAISALHGDGIELLKERLFESVTRDTEMTEATVSRERHYRAVCDARDAIQRTSENLRDHYPPEMIAEDLREALTAIDTLTGKHRLENLLNEIFSEFCIGK